MMMISNGIGSESRHGGLLAAIWEVRPTICVNVPLVSASDAPWDFLGVNVIISNKIQRWKRCHCFRLFVNICFECGAKCMIKSAPKQGCIHCSKYHGALSSGNIRDTYGSTRQKFGSPLVICKWIGMNIIFETWDVADICCGDRNCKCVWCSPQPPWATVTQYGLDWL